MTARDITCTHDYNGVYSGDHLNHVAFPMGGMGAGMICLEGTGALSHVSLRHRPDVYNEPQAFSALYVEGAATARVLEGPVPGRKVFGSSGTGNGAGGKAFGLPRFAGASFTSRFPFATVSLADDTMPLVVEITGWSPFVPGDADASSLPVCALEFSFENTSDKALKAVYSFHANNFMGTGRDSGASVAPVDGGFALVQPARDEAPHDEGTFVARVADANAVSDCAWFRGGWFDALTMVWKSVSTGEVVSRPPHAEGDPGNGASLYVPFEVGAGEKKTIAVQLSWYVPKSNIRAGWKEKDGGSCCGEGGDCSLPTHEPRYAELYKSATEMTAAWGDRYAQLREKSARFRDCFFDSTLPAEVVEAAAANLTILKSPTVMRQRDGRFWAWEGCCDGSGCCHGSCTHVWNYAQALCHLFPDMERSLRETEFDECQDERGHQNFRAWLPIAPGDHDFHAAADGQLGGIIKTHREWRVSGDSDWLKKLWPKVKASLDYCIETWDPDHVGALVEPHHNTYDIEFWGPDGMCSSFYLGALKAGSAMAVAVGDDASLYDELYAKGKAYLESELFDGEYFIQKIQWTGLRAPNPADVSIGFQMNYSAEARELLQKEGPKYQYGSGCISDGVLGAWLASLAGLGEVLDAKKVESHVVAVHAHNFRADLSDHANPQRPSYALGGEGGLLLCSWPKGGELSLPFVYSNEVWTGIEYQVAAHLMMCGRITEGLEIVRAVRDRYDGRVRNPFNEYECGHWYARAMSSYALLEGMTGVRYDAVDQVVTVAPRVAGDFKTFLATATGYASVGVADGEPFVTVVEGSIDVGSVDYTPYAPAK